MRLCMWACAPHARTCLCERGQDQFYERAVKMPNSYFANDYRHVYGHPQLSATRATDDSAQVRCGRRRHCFTDAQGVPHNGAILANFGQMYKIQPQLFALWCKALRGEPNASLWLLKFPAAAAPMVQAHFAKRHMPPHQLVLSELLPMDRHLSVKGLATLALDTLTFNGHTTGSDTLYAGVPLVSLPGDATPARAGASMAMALDEPTWLVRTLDEYFELVRRYVVAHAKPAGSCKQRQRMLLARQRLHQKLISSPLFDNERWTRDWERALRLIWDVYRSRNQKGAVRAHEGAAHHVVVGSLALS